MAYIALAGYEASVHGIEGKASLSGKLQGLSNLPVPEKGKEYNWGLAVNAAEYTLMRQLYATSGDVLKSQIDTLRRNYENKLKVGIDESERSIKFGVEIGQAIWQYAKNDGGDEAWNNNFPKSNSEFSGVGKWEPTGSQRRPLLPQWAEMRTFLTANAEATTETIPVFSFKNNTDFFAQAKTVYLTSSNLSQPQINIMNHWIDEPGTFTTAGHHLEVVRSLVAKEQYALDKAAVLYLKAALALHDSFVNSWKHKYTVNIMRPQTYIRQAINPTWTPNIESSPSPDYTSEEATAAAAIGLILSNEFGNEYAFEDLSKLPVRKAYKGFESYVQEASKAHLYAGVHFPVSIDNGIKLGQKIATNFLTLNMNSEPQQ
jgi:hypothetical protein